MTNDISSFREFPGYMEKPRRKMRSIIAFLGAFVILVALSLTGLYFLGENSKKSSQKISPQPTIVPSPTLALSATPSAAISPTGKVTPTGGKSKPTSGPTGEQEADTASLDRSELSVAVLNGSGEPGAAKGTSAYLNELGYTIKTIGNADEFSYKNITIRIKKSKAAYLDILKADLEKNSPSTPIATSQTDSISADAEVIVGK